MKGTVVFQLVKYLPQKEADRLLSAAQAGSNGDLLVKIIETFGKADKYEESSLVAAIGTSKGKKNELLSELGELVLGLIGNNDPEGKLMDAVVGVRKLVFQMKNEEAIHLLRWAMAEAERIEKFETILQLHELAWIITIPFKLNAISQEEAIRKHRNLLTFMQMENRLMSIKSKEFSSEDRANILQEIERSPLIASEENALSIRAKFIYCKIVTSLHFFNRKHDKTIEPQKRMLELIKETPWLKQGSDFFFTREMIVLSNFLAINEQFDNAESILFRIGNIDSREPRTAWEKTLQLYPYRLQLAISRGQREVGESECEKILTYISDNQDLPAAFITRNLYFVLYFYVAIGSYKKAAHQLTQLRRFSSTEFDPWCGEMTRLLEILVTFELGELEDIPRLVKNFRKLRYYQSTPYFKLVTGAFSRCSNPSNLDKQPVLFRTYLRKAAEIKEERNGFFFNWFDFARWLESKLNNQVLLDQFTIHTGSKRQSQPKTNQI